MISIGQCGHQQYSATKKRKFRDMVSNMHGDSDSQQHQPENLPILVNSQELQEFRNLIEIQKNQNIVFQNTLKEMQQVLADLKKERQSIHKTRDQHDQKADEKYDYFS